MTTTTPATPHRVCLTLLPRHLKRQVWNFIVTERPDLAALLSSSSPPKAMDHFREMAGPGLMVWVAGTDTGLSHEQFLELRESSPSALQWSPIKWIPYPGISTPGMSASARSR